MTGNQKTLLVFAIFVVLGVGGGFLGSLIGGNLGAGLGAGLGFGLSVVSAYSVSTS